MYTNILYFPCINITILKEHADLKITQILCVKHYTYTWYSTLITPILISRLSIDVIVFTPSTINYIHISMVTHAYSAIPILFCCVVSLIPLKVFLLLSSTPHFYKQLYTCVYTHLNKYNQLVIIISYLDSDCLIH